MDKLQDKARFLGSLRRSVRAMTALAAAALLVVAPTPTMAQSVPNEGMASVAVAPVSPATPDPSVAVAPVAPAGPDLDWIPADRADTDAAQGGWVYALYLVAGASTFTIKACARVDLCARGAVNIFNSYKAATAFTCKRYRRFC